MNTITIDINANLKNINDTLKNGAILYTLSHELTHIAEHATDEYVELRTAVQEVIGADNWDTMVQKHLSVLQETQPDEYNSMSETERTEYASKEALAEACSDMLKDSDILIKMAEDNPSLGKKIINTIKKLITKIRNWLAKNSEVQAKEAKLLKECADDLQIIVDKWEKAVIEGIKNQNAKQAVKDNSAQKQQKNNTDSKDGVESTGIQFSQRIESYPYNMQTVIKDYLNSVDNNLLTNIEKSFDNDSKFKRFIISNVSEKLANDVKDLLGINVADYRNAINTNAIQHIEKEHGENGTTDHSMANHNDLARIAYILANYDNIEIATYASGNFDTSAEFRNRDNTPAKMLIISKKINGTYYVAEAVPETSYKKLWVVSAYIKSGELTQAPNKSGSYLVSRSSANNSISQTTEKSNTQFQARDTYVDYTNTDLSTLDEKQLKVYNKRGWANALFTDEDRKLLNEKYNELNTKTKQRTDNVLGDGSRVVEVNNKLVLIGGAFEEPVIHNVLVINADNETEADIVKEFIRYESSDYRRNQNEYKEFLVYVQTVEGEEFVRTYSAEDFRHIKGRNTERATLPSNFQYYGYTKQFQDGRGDSSETEQGISDEVEYQPRGLAMSDSELLANAEDTVNAKPTFDLSDDFTFDDDLFDFEDESRKIEFDKLVNKIFHFLIQFYSIIKNLFVKLIQRGDFYVK